MTKLLFIYFFTYIFSLCGFLLGRATKEEHAEIESKVLLFAEIFMFIHALIFVYFFHTHYFLSLMVIAFTMLFSIVKRVLKSEDLKEFYYLIILAISSITFYNYNFENIYFILIIVISMILDKSMKKFILRKEIYTLIMYGIIYFFYYLATQI